MTRTIVLCFVTLLMTAGRVPATPAVPEAASVLSVTSWPARQPKEVSQFPFGLKLLEEQPADTAPFKNAVGSKSENGSAGLVVAGILLVLFRWLQPAFSPRRFT